MRDLFIHHVRTELAGEETAAATRERLKSFFKPGATRRMSQLGMLLGATFDGLTVNLDDAVIYTSTFSETRSLEMYLESFPTPSPLGFQTSIHPSAVQQTLIARQCAVREFLPVTGGADIIAQAATLAFTSPAPRIILCGGEERGTWLLEQKTSAETCFAFTLVLSRESAGSIGRLSLSDTSSEPQPALTIDAFAAALAGRRAVSTTTAAGLTLSLSWS